MWGGVGVPGNSGGNKKRKKRGKGPMEGEKKVKNSYRVSGKQKVWGGQRGQSQTPVKKEKGV